jgi:[ribosomal protein S5]-alanine N-acetyltransferase
MNHFALMKAPVPMIETDRLRIRPLTHSQLIKYLRADNSLEIELEVKKSPRTIPPDLLEALENTILPNVADPGRNYLYSTLWTIISKEENKMIGDLCFVGEPNAEGEIEVGYGTYEEYRNRGFMTEALGGMIRWAVKQPGVKSIIAATEKSNKASYSILERNQFVQVAETDHLTHWRLKLGE